MTYFWTPKPIGIKADIQRHCEEQQRLEEKIRLLEEDENSNKIFIRTYRELLNRLLESKAQVVERLGRV